MAIIEITNLTVKTRESQKPLVKDISFSLPDGTVTGLVGESGSGKSLTALSVMQLLPHSLDLSGRIVFGDLDGKNLLLTSANEKQLMRYRGASASMIFQDPMSSLNPSQKAGSQVLEAIKLHSHLSNKKAIAKVLEMFEIVQLPLPQRIYNAYPFQLSGGQRQRVMIAMALINNPRLLIADEATTALDVTVQHEIINLIKHLQQEFQLTVLFITHDLALLHKFADRVIVMQNGSIVEQGTYGEVIDTPKQPYTKGLLACRPAATERNIQLPVIEDFENQSTFVPRQLERLKPDTYQILTAKGISVKYKQKRKQYFQALQNIDFDIKRGETLGIVGESGCGKTTLSKAILQMIPHDGNFLFNNQPLIFQKRHKAQQFRKRVQFVFQDPYSSLNPTIKIGQAIKEVLRVHNINNKERRTRELLEQVGLPLTFMSRYPHELSGGQRQRVAIARALATEPEMLILDEAVTALDVSVQAKVLNLLNELKKALGLTYIFIAHDLEVVYYMADRIIVMQDGQIVEKGDATQIFNRPAAAYTRKLINSIPGVK